MRIGIVTYWNNSDNYGGMLQSYALQRYLRDKGEDVFLIRFKTAPKISTKNAIKSFIKRTLISLKLYKEKTQHVSRRIHNKERDFQSFCSKHLFYSERVYLSLQELQNDPPVADAYIAGSDQLWSRPLNCPSEEIFYLNFGSDKIKRYGYAISFGHEKFPCVNESRFRQLAERFEVLSMREDSGVEICKERGFDAVRSIDPSFLLDKEHYMSLMSERKHNYRYAYFYTVNVSTKEELYWDELRDYFLSHEIKPVVTTGSGYILSQEIFDGAIYDYATIEGWLSNIYHSDVVVTASFHGVAFAIIMQKDFVYIPFKGKNSDGNNRITDLLSLAGLADRCAKSQEDAKRLSYTPIRYDDINKDRLDKLIKESKDYINSITTLNNNGNE